jgi:hypothetical protein
MIQNKCTLPSIIFDDSKVSKMHDSLPLTLFSMKTFYEILDEMDYTSLVVVAPWTFLCRSLIDPKITISQRIHLLEISFFILWFHYRMFEIHGTPKCTKERPKKMEFATLYTTRMIIESLNTIFSLIVILRNAAQEINLNRIGSNPLEHLFGKSRNRCRDVNTFDRFMRSFTSYTLDSTVDKVLNLLSINKRKTSVGVIVSDILQEGDLEFSISSEVMAELFYCLSGLPIHRIFQSVEISKKNLEKDIFIQELYKWQPYETSPRQKYHSRRRITKSISSNQVLLNVLTGFRSQSLVKLKSTIFRITSKDEIENQLKELLDHRPNVQELRSLITSILKNGEFETPQSRKKKNIYLTGLEIIGKNFPHSSSI